MDRQGHGPRVKNSAIARRFRVQKCLGQGNFGIVYSAEDVETGQQVALKELPSRFTADEFYYIKQEFRFLRGIQHPNLVALYELVPERDQCFFTMELIDGLPFTNYIWSQGGRPSATAGLSAPALTALRRALRRLARGVCALHRRGKIHRDIKPGNVLVTNEGRVVLLDFGLATHLQPKALHNSDVGDAIGTPCYMSPEQHRGKLPTQAADWYSVGVLLLEVLSGELPLEAPSQVMLAIKEASALPSLQKLAPDTPTELEKLVRALLHPDPKQRAGERELLEATEEADRVPTQVPLWEDPVVLRASFVGRAAEMTELRSVFERTSRQGPALVCIEGTSGIGKTEFAESFLNSVSKQALILRGACHHQELVRFKAFDEIIDDLSQYLSWRGRDIAGALSPQRAAALRQVFPVLKRVRALSAAGNIEGIPPQELRLIAFQALRDLLRKLAEVRPLILWIDDLQWGDADSAPLFRELLRSPNTSRFMLMVAYRSEDRADSVLLQSLAAIEEATGARAHRLSLDKLSPEESLELAKELFTQESGTPPVDAIAKDAAGVPFFLVEFARYINAGLDAEAQGPLDADWLTEILRRRVELLTGDERTILEIVSVAGKQMNRSLLLQAAGLGERGRNVILRLSQKNLLRPTELDARPAIEIYHARFREFILVYLEMARRRRHHRKLAEALESQQTSDLEDLFVHYDGAGEDPKARKYALLAADRAMETLAFARAAELYRWLLSRPEQDSPRWKLLEKLGEALANAGHTKEAGEAFKDAAEEREKAPSRFTPEAAEKALDLRRQAAEQYLRGGYVSEGVQAVSQVLGAVGLDYPASPLRAWVSMLAWRTVLDVRGLGYKERSKEQIPRRELDRIDACWSAGLGLGWIDRTRTAAFQARGALLALEAGEPSRVAQTLITEASQLASFGGAVRQKRSEEVLAEARGLAEKSGDPWLSAFLVLMEGSMAFYASRWRNAQTLCRTAQEMFRKRARAAGWEVTTANLLSLGALTYLGELDELKRELPGLVDEAEARGDLISAASLASGLPNILWLSQDQPDEARRRAEKAIKQWEQDDFQFPHYLHLIASTQIELYHGDGRAAWQCLTRASSRLAASFLWIVENLRITLLHLYARGAIAAASSAGGDARGALGWAKREGLLRTAEGGAAQLEREEAVLAGPLAKAIRAGVAAARGQNADASRSLEQAARLFTNLDMALYAAAARYQQGAVMEGEAGRAARREGDAWMREHGVVNPGKLAAMLVPGMNA